MKFVETDEDVERELDKLRAELAKAERALSEADSRRLAAERDLAEERAARRLLERPRGFTKAWAPSEKAASRGERMLLETCLSTVPDAIKFIQYIQGHEHKIVSVEVHNATRFVVEFQQA